MKTELQSEANDFSANYRFLLKYIQSYVCELIIVPDNQLHVARRSIAYVYI